MKSNLNFKAIGMFVMLFVLVVSASSVQTASAQRSAITATSETKPELQVKFLGSAGEFLFFELAMQQNDETRSNLRIRYFNCFLYFNFDLYELSYFTFSSVVNELNFISFAFCDLQFTYCRFLKNSFCVQFSTTLVTDAQV